MSFETGVAWYDALPGLDLTQCDSPSDHWRRLFWSAQIAKTRGAARPGHVASLHVLACTLLTGYRCGLGPECLSESLCLLRDLHGRGLGLARWILDFGEALFVEHERTRAIEPIQEMVRVHEEAPIAGTLGLDIRCQLAKALITRGLLTGEDADLSQAKCILEAIGLLLGAGSSPHFAIVSAMHCIALIRTCGECALRLEDMRSLADTLQGYLQCTDRRMQRYQMDLQAAYFSISARICHMTDCLEDLKNCVQMADAALLSLPHNSFAVTIALNNFCMWFEVFGGGERRYVQHSRRLVERLFHAAKGNCILMSEAHDTLGRWMCRSRNWALDDYTNSLEIAATHERQALALCPPNHIHRYQYLVGLSQCLIRLYHLNGTRNALNEAIALFDQYADVARRLPPFAINVSIIMCRRAESGRLRMDSKLALVQRAVQILQDAVLVTSPSSPYYGVELICAISDCYLLQSSWGCSISITGTEHLVIVRRAVAAAVGGPAHSLLGMEHNLAEVLINNARQTHDAALLHEAIALLESISKRLLVVNTYNLDGQVAWLRATAYMIRYGLLGISEDLQTAEAIFQSLCSGWVNLPNTSRLPFVLAWADAAHYAEQHAMEMRAYQFMVGLLSQLACLGEEVATQVEALQLAEGLACRVAPIFLTCGDIHGAIELLEQSRGVVWNQTLRLKTPISSVPPDYAGDFARITGALKQTSNDTSDASIKRRDSATELDGLLERIRQVEGYEHFLLPRLYTELATCTSHGVVVFLIPSNACTDVVIMRSANVTPTHLRLPSIQLHRLQNWTAELKRSCDQSRDAVSGDRMGMKISASSVLSSRDKAYMKILRELWLEIVQPVLASLGVEVRICRSFFRPLKLILSSSATSRIWDRARGCGGARRVRLPSCLSTRLASIRGLVKTVLLTMPCHLTPRHYPH
jgi:hypothetical protein